MDITTGDNSDNSDNLSDLSGMSEDAWKPIAGRNILKQLFDRAMINLKT